MRAIRISFLYRHAAVLVLLALAVGCSDSGASDSSAPPPECDVYDVLHMKDSRLGYRHMTIRYEERSGEKVLLAEESQRLVLKRFGQSTRVEIHYQTVETLGGTLREIQSEMTTGTSTVKTSSRLVDGQFETEVTTEGKKTRASIAWSDEYGGPLAPEMSLMRRPMKPGEQREVKCWDPMTNRIITVKMTAKETESVKLLDETKRLLRVEVVLHHPGGTKIPGTVWCDEKGQTQKQHWVPMQMVYYRTTKAVAMKGDGTAEVDLGEASIVRVASRLARPHDTKRVRYRLTLDGGDPAKAFTAGPSQQIKSTGPGKAELIVYAVRPGQEGGNTNAPADKPTDDDLKPNNLIQSDYPRIVAAAKGAAGNEADPWKIACKLERYVNQQISLKNFSQVMATAAEVADNPVGDCTEHAVLLAALARARGIPARVAVGLVYMQGRQSFGYHMWNEVYIDGRWIPIDATLARGGIGAAHLKLVHANLKGVSPMSVFLPVANVMGRLKIEIVEAE